jgi:transposase
MAKGYRRVDRDQGFLLPPDMRQWLPAGHPVWLVIEAVRLLDTSAFHARRRTGGAGTAGYDPDMLVTVLVWAYANGITSSRRIERLCGQDVAFRVICAGQLPDHVTVARFRQQFAGTAAVLFGQVLVLCARLGMGQVGVVAVDGTKIAASASKDANRTEEGLAKLAEGLAARHAATDAEEDALFGAGQRGDDDPGDPQTRAERVSAALASLVAERQAREAAEAKAAEEHLQAARAGTPGKGRPPAGAEAEAARMRLDQETAACRARVSDWERRKAAGQRVRRRPVPPEESSLVRRAAVKLEAALARQGARAAAEQENKKAAAVRNITDPGSRLMPVRGGGFIQGYNAQNADSQDGLVIATRLTDDTTGYAWYEPMIAAAAAAAAMMAAHQPPVPASTPATTGPGKTGLALADAGYCSEANLTCPGPDRLIATGKRRDLDKAARTASQDHPQAGPAGQQPATAQMAARLATPEGIAAYRMRGHIAETPHANIKHNPGIRRLSMRGMSKASGEWTFICAVHNLTKAITTGHLTTQTLATLPG